MVPGAFVLLTAAAADRERQGRSRGAAGRRATTRPISGCLRRAAQRRRGDARRAVAGPAAASRRSASTTTSSISADIRCSPRRIVARVREAFDVELRLEICSMRPPSPSSPCASRSANRRLDSVRGSAAGFPRTLRCRSRRAAPAVVPEPLRRTALSLRRGVQAVRARSMRPRSSAGPRSVRRHEIPAHVVSADRRRSRSVTFARQALRPRARGFARTLAPSRRRERAALVRDAAPRVRSRERDRRSEACS